MPPRKKPFEELENLDMRDAWRRYQRGDHVTDEELVEMERQLSAALPYLESRPDFGIALRQSLQDLNTIQDYREARKRT